MIHSWELYSYILFFFFACAVLTGKNLWGVQLMFPRINHKRMSANIPPLRTRWSMFVFTEEATMTLRNSLYLQKSNLSCDVTVLCMQVYFLFCLMPVVPFKCSTLGLKITNQFKTNWCEVVRCRYLLLAGLLQLAEVAALQSAARLVIPQLHGAVLSAHTHTHTQSDSHLAVDLCCVTVLVLGTIFSQYHCAVGYLTQLRA